MQARENKVSSTLDMVEQEFKQGRLHFHLMEGLLLDKDAKSLLHADSDLRAAFTKKYWGLIETFALQLRDISRFRFLALKKEEFIFMADNNPATSPNGCLFTQHVSNLTMNVKLDVLQCATVNLGALAYQRWIAIATYLTNIGDYSSGLAIFSALNTMPGNAKFSANLSAYATQNFTELNRLYSPALHFNLLRELFMGSCIPPHTIYGNFLKSSAENAKGLQATTAGAVKADLAKDDTVKKLIDALCNLQKNNTKLLNPALLPHKLTTTETVQFISKDALLQRLITLANSLKIAVPPDYEQSSHALDGLFSDIAKKRITTANTLADELEMKNANAMWDVIGKHPPTQIPEHRVRFENSISALRKYTDETGKDERGMRQRQLIKSLLDELNKISSIRKRMNFIALKLWELSKNEIFTQKLRDYWVHIKLMLEKWYDYELIKSFEARAGFQTITENTSPLTILNRFSVAHKAPHESIPPLALSQIDTERRVTLLDTRPNGADNKAIHEDDIAAGKVLRRGSSANELSVGSLRGSVLSPGSTLSRNSKSSPKQTAESLFRNRSSSNAGSNNNSPISSPKVATPVDSGSPQASPKSLPDLIDSPARRELGTPSPLNSPALSRHQTPERQLPLNESVQAPVPRRSSDGSRLRRDSFLSVGLRDLNAVSHVKETEEKKESTDDIVRPSP